MVFQDKYVKEKDKSKLENVDKVVISDEAYAIGDILQDVVNQLRNNIK